MALSVIERHTYQRPLMMLINVVVIIFISSPAHSSERNHYIRLGEEAYYRDHYPKSIEYFQKALEKDPDNVLAQIRIGQMHYAQFQFDEARRVFEEALKMKEAGLYKKYLQHVTEKMKVYEQRLGHIQNLHQTNGKEILLVKLHYEIAAFMSEGESYMSLISPHLEYILDKDPSNTDILRYIGDGYYLSSDMPLAVKFYEKLVKITPNDFQVREKLADAYAAIRNFDKAKTEYQQTIEKGDLFYFDSDDGKAKKEWRKKKKKIANIITALPPEIFRIDQLISDNQYEKAEYALRRRIALNPSDVVAMTMLGRVKDAQGKTGEAYRLFTRAGNLYPEYQDVHFYLGQHYLLKRKEYEPALRELELFRKYLLDVLEYTLEEEQKNQQIKNMILATEYIGYIYAEILKDYKMAIKELKRVSKWDPDNAQMYFNLGALYLRQKNESSAARYFKKVIDMEDEGSGLAKKAEEAIDYIQSYNEEGIRYAGPYD